MQPLIWPKHSWRPVASWLNLWRHLGCGAAARRRRHRLGILMKYQRRRRGNIAKRRNLRRPQPGSYYAEIFGRGGALGINSWRKSAMPGGSAGPHLYRWRRNQPLNIARHQQRIAHENSAAAQPLNRCGTARRQPRGSGNQSITSGWPVAAASRVIFSISSLAAAA